MPKKTIVNLIKLESKAEAFQILVEEKSVGRQIDFSNPDDVQEFFGDEDFPEYEEEWDSQRNKS